MNPLAAALAALALAAPASAQSLAARKISSSADLPQGKGVLARVGD